MEFDLFTLVLIGTNISLALVAILQMFAHRREINIRFRAWIGRNGDKKICKKITDEGNTITLPIRNHGTLAARHIVVRQYISETKEWEFEESGEEPFDMTPGETVDLIHYNNKKTGKLYYGWRLEYYKDDKGAKDLGVYELRGMIDGEEIEVHEVKAR